MPLGFAIFDRKGAPDDCITSLWLPEESFPTSISNAAGATALNGTTNRLAGKHPAFRGDKQPGTGDLGWDTSKMGTAWAHELGHTLGLDHPDCKKPENKNRLMCHDFGTVITDKECDDARKSAANLRKAFGLK